MSSKSAGEVFSSPEAKALGTGLVVGGLVATAPVSIPTAIAVGGAVAIASYLKKQGMDGAEADKRAAEEAFKTAQGLQTKVEQTGTNTTQGTTSNTQTSGTTFAPKSAQEQALLDSSIANFGKQGALVDDSEAGITGRLGTQGQARDALGNVLGGQAFDLTPSEEARINNLRNADIGASSNAVNELLTQRLGEVNADAQRRGLRGQAFTQLQGDAMGSAARELNRATLDANKTAAQNAIAMPGQRVGIQAGAAGHFADFADAARQQAIQNRQTLQDPVALQQLFDERMRGGTTTGTTTGTTDQTTSTADSRIGTGEGAAGVLQAGIGLPSAQSAGNAAVLGTLGAVAPIIGGAIAKP